MEPPRSLGSNTSRPRLLIASTSHGEPPTKLRLARAIELGRHLSALGAVVEQALVLEEELVEGEWDEVCELRESSASLTIVPGRRSSCGWRRLLGPATALWPLRGRFGTGLGELRSRLWKRVSEARFDAVVLVGERLLALLPRLSTRVATLADLSRLRAGGTDEEYRQLLDAPERRVPALRWLERAGAVIAACNEDVEVLRESGVRVPVLKAPPTASPAPTPESPLPVRPPRVLAVGSETVANLDGLRWFRRRVLPAVLRSVPSARLRVVGEAGRFLEPGPDVDRVGWVRDLSAEYAAASVVLLPLRVVGGLRRRAVEAIAHGRALALTAAAAYGLDLSGGRDAVVAADEATLARGVAEVLVQDSVRRLYEGASRLRAAERFHPAKALAPLAAFLGLQEPPSGETEREDVSCVASHA